MDELLPVLAFDPHRLSPESPLWLEIGFGAGEHLAWQAAQNPGVTLVGCEVYRNGIAACLGRVARDRLVNVRVWPADARDLIDEMPDASVDRAFLLFPDPWPKARHAERRFVAPANLDSLARILKPGAELRLATDDLVYLRWTLERLPLHPAFCWQARGPSDWRERPADWPPTRFEQKAIAEGRKPAYLRFRRR
jgi:tRNA (guanine-N7-)-methyltransferase